MFKRSGMMVLSLFITLMFISAIGCNYITNLGQVEPTEEIQDLEMTEAPMEILEPEEPVVTESLMGESYITDVVMAKSVEGENFDPIDATNTFDAQNSEFHCVVTIQDAPAGTVYKAVWSVVLVEGIDAGTLMGETELQADGSRNLDFSFVPDAGSLPAGSYQVEIYVNGSLAETEYYEVTP